MSIFETERLILRHPVVADTDPYLAICNSNFARRYNAMTIRSRENVQQQFSKENDDLYVLCLKQNGAVIGAVYIEEDSVRYGVKSKEISYFLAEEYSRQGFMREALTAIIDYLFGVEGLSYVASRVFAPNVASRCLLESLGFQQNGLIPHCVKGYNDIIFDDTLYSISKKDW